MKRISLQRVALFTLIGLVLLVAGGSFYLRSRSDHPDPAQYAAVVQGARVYADQLRARGEPIPALVTLEQLVASGAVLADDARGFKGLEVSISPRTSDELEWQDPIMRVRFPDGREIVAMNDGSVQQRGP